MCAYWFGSLRKASFNGMLANALISLAPRKRPRLCAPSGSLLVTGSPPLSVRRTARRTCRHATRSASRLYNGNDPHREENVTNVPDAILYCGLFTTLLVAALKRNCLRDRSNSQAT